MNASVSICFDASLREEHSGACFTIQARDWEHARQIAEWLRTKTENPTLLVRIPVEPVTLTL